jgi:hypothetical protein
MNASIFNKKLTIYFSAVTKPRLKAKEMKREDILKKTGWDKGFLSRALRPNSKRLCIWTVRRQMEGADFLGIPVSEFLRRAGL